MVGRVLVLVIGICFGSNSFAGVGGAIKKYFDATGATYNVTGANYYDMQGAGFVHGGSVVFRSPSRTVDIVHCEFPRIKFGCGSMDLDIGGFSAIKGKEFVKSLKSIGTASASYAFMLGLKVIAPQIEGTMSRINDWRIKYLNQSFNTCDVGAAGVAGLAGLNTATKEHWCKMDGIRVGKFSDSLAGQMCDNPSVLRDIDAKARKAGKIRLTDNFNVAFEAVKKNPFLKSMDSEMKALVMALTGTIIVKDGVTTPIASNLKSGLTALLVGGTVEGLHCSDERCLVFKKKTIKVSFEKSMSGRTRGLLEVLANAAILGKKLETSVMKAVNTFLSRQNYSVYTNISASVSATGGISALKVQEYSEVLAIDLMAEFLSRIIVEMKAGLAKVKPNVGLSLVVPDFEKGLDEIIKSIRAKRFEIYKRARINSGMEAETRVFRQVAISNVDIGGLL